MEVNQVYEWLFEYDGDFLGPTVKKFVGEMHVASENGNHRVAWSLVDCIPGLCDEYGLAREMAQARVECARVVYRLGDLKRASDFLDEATTYYLPLDYHRGVTYCLLGIVFSEMRGGEEEALVAWRISRRMFRDYCKKYRWLQKSRIESCEQKREEIRKAIWEVIQRLNGE